MSEPDVASPIEPPEAGARIAPPDAEVASATGGWSSAPPVGTRVPPAKKRSKAVLGLLGIGAALIATVGGKFLLGFFAASIVGSAVSGLFGGPWERLPSDVRGGYEQRLEAVLGDRLDGLSEADASKQVGTWLSSGLLRLDDGRIVRHLELSIEALGRSKETTCAAFGRQSISGQEISDDTSSVMISSLEEAGLVEWIGLNVDAIEAELRGSPDQVRISDDQSTPVLEQLVAKLAPAELATIGALTSGGTATDAEVCTAIRSLYGGALDLDPASKAILARFDIQP